MWFYSKKEHLEASLFYMLRDCGLNVISLEKANHIMFQQGNLELWNLDGKVVQVLYPNGAKIDWLLKNRLS